MKLKMSIMLSTLLLGNILHASNVNITTKYGKTGGVLGPLNKTTDKINGRAICSVDPTPGCDFDDDPKFNNNNTVDDPSDDSYSGDLLVRTNDNFQAIAGWTWNGTAGGAEEVATITGTLPAGGYYEWAALPGSCNLANSSISADKQTIICERKDFDKNDAGTYSEDLTFNVRVLGGTPSGTQPGDIKFKVEAPNATAVEDTTDGNSLTVTASPRWNLDKAFGAYSVRSGQTVTIDGQEKEGWVIDYRLLIETDEVNGEIDNTYSLLGNESLGADATLTFTDDLSNVSPNAKLLDCRTTGRAYSDGTLRDGYDGSNLPITFSGEGSIKPTQVNSHLPQAKDEQQVTCTQTGSSVAVEVKHVDATLNHYPTRDYYDRPLPVNRAIASMVNMSIFIPLEDVKAGPNGTVDCDGYGIGRDDCDDGELITKNYVTDFNPVSASGVQNFSGQGESEKDNYRTYTLQYSAGSFDKYYWGDKNSIWNGPAESTSSRQGDRFVGKGYEWSSRLYANNSGGVNQTENGFCDVIDANYMEIIKYSEKTNYTDTRYNHEDELPFITYTSIGKGTPDNHLYNGSKLTDYYDFEFAGDYEDDSFLPSNNNNRQDENQDAKTRAECDAPANKWYATMDEARNAAGGVGAVTKVRWKLKPNMLMVPGQSEYWMLLHRVRENRLDNNEPLQPGDMMVNYGKHKFDGNQGTWSNTSYIPHGLDTDGIPEGFSGAAGDRMFYTDAKVRIRKEESRTSATPGNEVTYSFKMSFTDDIRTQGESDSVKLTDILPKDFKYQKGSVTPSSYGEPIIGSCADAIDINSTESPCVDGENQVLIWDLGTREINADIADLNYTALIGAAAKVGTNTNVVKIESPADASPISQRKSEIGLIIDVPASINIVKSTEENPDYPSKRERTTEPKDIYFLMDMRNGKDGDITDLDVIDILPFEGDADDAAIKFNNLELKRKKATSFHGSMIFHEASFNQHPGSDTACDMSYTRGGDYSVKYYYTNADPKTINMAPTVGDENDITNAQSIWCEGDATGPNGCTIASSGFTFSSNSQVTAVRARGPRMEKQAICQFKVHVTVDDNLAGDNYSNSAGASATGITLPVLSNSLAVPVVGSSLGDRVWYDRNANGIQDEGENGVEGVTVKLLDGSGNPVKNPLTGADYVTTTGADGVYGFNKLNQGSYIVEIVPPAGYIVSKKEEGSNSAIDSDINSDSNRTDVITLDVEEDNPTIDMGIFTPIISGNVFSDGNGDGTINGTKIATASGTQLYVTLLSNSGDILATKPLLADGTYTFDGEDGVQANSDYRVVISSSSNTATSTLPDNWNHADGEHVGTGVGTDGTADGIIDVKVLKENVPNVNFGINEKPVAQDKTEAPQLNPGADVKVSVPDLNVTDREDGTPTTITITTLPTNGKLYYNGNLVTVNEAIENADPSKFTVDPDNGDQTVVFNYTTTDKVGVVSDEATVTMPFRGLKISGNIFDDGSGDDTINGTKISSPDSKQLYATLLSGDGAVLATKAISAGAYSFNGDDGIKPNSSYTVVLSTEANATEAKLPTDWNHADGEHIGTTEGTDGDADGSISVSVEGVDVPEVNFGINNKPTAVDKAEPTQANPGKDNQVVVPTLSIADKEDGTPTTITITTVPANGKLYYDGDEVNAGDTLTDFDPSKFTVDPDNGDQTLEFKYTATDRAGVVSDEAKVTLPFTDIAISGKLFDDGNANGNVDGNLTAKADNTQLYVTLVDANGDAVASKPLGADGTYSFSNVDGVTPNTNYTMVLSDEVNRTTPKLPENWNNADGENIGLNGVDGDANGIVAVNVASTHISEINFGINKKPVADDKTEPTQFNPGSDVQVSVPTLTVSDKEDGTPAIVTIRTLPTNATLYYDGVKVTVDMEIADLTLLTVDPDDGDQTVLFTYTSTDVTGMVSNPATVTMPFKGIKIAGNIFNDGNADGTVNGTPIASPNGTQLHATLLDVNGTAIATTPIAEDGTYSFGNKDGVLPNHSYSVVLSTTANSNEASLPVNWNNADGEHIGTNKGLDDAPDGVINVTVVEKDVVEVNFGINKKPVAGDNTGELQLNPGTDVQVNVIDLNVSDSEDTTPSTVTIKTVPSNGTLYYDGVEVVANQVIENFDNSKLTLDPNNGSLTVSFTYTTTDGSGVESDIATIAMPFKGLKISGNIFNDGNNNGIVDGDLTSKADEVALYAVLLDSNGNFMAREAIKADGSYDFDGLDGIVPNSTYNVVLTSDANGTTAMLPTTWTNADGEHIGADTGLDRVADGAIKVVVTTKDIPEINFGINKRPVADDKTEPEQLNTSRDAQYVVPTLTVSDKEDGVPAVITIRTLPTNGTLYYEGTPVEVNATIADPSKLTIDPDDGDQNVTFTYTSTDVTGAISDPATVVMPFIGVKISGYIFADGNNDETVNGTQIATVDGVQLYATLLNENNETLATVAIDSNGSYLFENKDGVYPNNNYHVVLSTEANATTASLPENWNHADGEHIGRDKGLDDNANGVIAVSVVTTDIPEVNFGINKRPVVEDVTSVVQANPGADKQVQVIDLGIRDNEDGSPKTVTIVSLPTEGTLYYDGVEVTEGQIIPNFDNKLLTVDPKNGATKIEFDYTTTDNTGWESEKARATMPFAAVAPAENFTAEDDAQPASLEGPVTTINVLENDVLGENSTIHLLNINDGTVLWNEGTAVGSATINTQDSVVVPGEGVWTVSGSTVVFTAEEGFTGIPTPIYYVVEDDQGNQTNVAQVAVISNCVCDTYEKSASDSVSALNPWWMIVGMFFISILGALFARREFEELK